MKLMQDFTLQIINYTLVPYINDNEMKLGFIPTIHYMQTFNELIFVI